MTDIDFIIGFAAGIAIAYLYDLVARHQRRKRRQAYSQQALRDRHF